MGARVWMAGLLVVLGLGGIWLGIRGWSHKQELVDASLLEVAITERETSPLLAGLGGLALLTGLMMFRCGRDPSPI